MSWLLSAKVIFLTWQTQLSKSPKSDCSCQGGWWGWRCVQMWWNGCKHYTLTQYWVNLFQLRLVSQLVGALSPVSHKGLHQGWTQTSLCFQSYSFHEPSYHKSCFWAYLYSAGTQHGNLHPAGWSILFCGSIQEPVLATANTGKNWEVLEKM